MAELIAVKRFIWLRWTVEGMSRAYVKRCGWVVVDENWKMCLKTLEYICVYFYDQNYNLSFHLYSSYLFAHKNIFFLNLHFQKRKNNAKCLIVMPFTLNFDKKQYKKGFRDINVNCSVICILRLINVSNSPMVFILADSFFSNNTVICWINDSSCVNKISICLWHWHHVWRKVLLLR